MFSDNFYPELSGISDSLVESARELSGLGYDIDFYVPRYSAKDFAMVHLPDEEIALGETVVVHRFFSFPYPAPTKQGRMVIPTLLRFLGMRSRRPDIIHTHLFFGCGIEGLAASFFLGTPLVGTSHTPVTEFMKYSPLQSRLLEKIALRLVSWYYNRCDFVTAPSQGILDEMKQHGFYKPCRAISNPIDLDNFFPATAEERAQVKQSFSLSPFTVLYTGRIAREKHIDVIIRAIALAKKTIPDIGLAITGHGDAEESLKQLADELDVEMNVKFFGTVSTEDHARIYRGADVFAIMSTAETQSLSMMKAMATGIPVIGANARALPEYINDANGFIVEPGDAETLAEKIIFLYQHPEERARLGQGGQATVKKFSRAAIAAEWNELYKTIAEKHKKNQ
jgi:glycosyltransferase involved in cell wall biosynthesis